MVIRPATAADLPALAAHLAACGLPDDGLEDCLADFRVAAEGDDLLGCAGLERCGDRLGLLRSLAVRPERRDQGIARELCAALAAHAGHLGIARLYLLTTTAAGYFARLGYRPLARAEAPDAIRATAQFHQICPDTAVLMAGPPVIGETMNDQDTLRQQVRAAYGAVARAEGNGCCGSQPAAIAGERIGYSAAELAAAPEGAHLGLGCGNPQAIAALKPGETVLDLGSGAGFDCFLAAAAVGEAGRVIGIDMTPDMLTKARANADKGGHGNVDFRLGEIEALPVADASVDVIISNCVINLSPDKARVFREAYRVLKPGGRLAISDVVASNDLPDDIRRDLHLYSCCIGGAAPVAELEALLASAGFSAIRITAKDESREFIRDWAPGRGVENYVVSANIEAVKPGAKARTHDGAPPLHASIVALAALSANIAANHPKQGLCQLEKLRGMGVAESHIDTVIEIARHIRDEAGQALDSLFDEKAAAVAAPPAEPPAKPKVAKGKPIAIAVAQAGTCCTPTKSGQSCC